MPISVTSLYRYPVKGLSPDPRQAIDLTPGQGVPGDRRFALALASTRFDPAAPKWMPKTAFLMLMRNEKLAALETLYDETGNVLTIHREGRQVARGALDTPIGRAMIEDFFDAFLRGDLNGKPRLVSAPGHMFSDHQAQVVSIINLASVRDLERVVGTTVDPIRFRANVYIDGVEPWQEFTWLDRTLSIGGATVTVADRIDRCAATNVRPGGGDRDMNIPLALQRGYGHIDCGVFARVTAGGRVAVGDAVNVEK